MPVSDDPFVEASHFQMDIWCKNVCIKNLLHSLCLIVLVGSRRYLQGNGVSVLCNVSMSKCQNSKAGAGLVVSITTASSHYLYLP